jgi:hypothetical protein
MTDERTRLRRHLDAHGFDGEALEPLVEARGDTIFGLEIPGDDALAGWRELRRSLPGVWGYWPVILGSREDLAYHRESVGLLGGRDPRDIIARSESVYATLCAEDGLGLLDIEIPHEARPPVGKTPHPRTVDRDPVDLGSLEPDALRTTHDILGEPRALLLGLVPTSEGWEVPAYLNFGGYNACPEPARQVAMLRYWHHRHGADLTTLTHRSAECLLTHPPASWKQAFILAQQQFEYCEDIVASGIGNLRNLAETLMDEPHWYFWWD